ncbi:hypothetical protein KY285_033184 [Solanum tuberosum]|nr:hypothetical protein KY289_033288 [Solanum tuberosum]KAH0647936.1 hypothetical protein KY285_033184 [Solanum tuberosum]
METLGKKWSELIDLLQSYKVEYFSKVVRWFPPSIRWLKCNIDGASKGNPGLNSVAFCIRDHTGDLVVTIGKKIQDVPSLKAEALAIKECLEYCHIVNYKKIILEADSWSLVQILQGTWESPWNVILEIKSIRSLLEGKLISTMQTSYQKKGDIF